MKIIGNAQLEADRATVWRALNDPAVLVACIPGCQRLEALGEDSYAMTVAAGVGSIKGVYSGQVRLRDQDHPGSFRMQADGAGAAGTIAADVLVTLTDAGARTSVDYDADATVGGMIGGVGQRMLVGVSKRMAAEFFDNVDAALRGAIATGSSAGGRADGAGATVDGSGGRREAPDGFGAPASGDRPPETAPGAVYTAPSPPRRDDSFGRGVAVGALSALAGALVGAWIARRTAR